MNYCVKDLLLNETFVSIRAVSMSSLFLSGVIINPEAEKVLSDVADEAGTQSTSLAIRAMYGNRRAFAFLHFEILQSQDESATPYYSQHNSNYACCAFFGGNYLARYFLHLVVEFVASLLSFFQLSSCNILSGYFSQFLE